MSARRGGLAMRFSLRIGRRRWLFQFPPERRGWLIALAVVLMLVGYVVGGVPAVMALERSGLMSSEADMVIQVLYAPLIWLDMHVSTCHAFFEAEGRFLDWLFGE